MLILYRNNNDHVNKIDLTLDGKMLENAADSHTSGARFVGRIFY